MDCRHGEATNWFWVRINTFFAEGLRLRADWIKSLCPGTYWQPTRDFEPVKSLPKMKLGLVTEWDSAKILRFQTPKKTGALRHQIGWVPTDCSPLGRIPRSLAVIVCLHS
jgi:hypothetical protein